MPITDEKWEQALEVIALLSEQVTDLQQRVLNMERDYLRRSVAAMKNEPELEPGTLPKITKKTAGIGFSGVSGVSGVSSYVGYPGPGPSGPMAMGGPIHAATPAVAAADLDWGTWDGIDPPKAKPMLTTPGELPF
jgi:hypothetical protein